MDAPVVVDASLWVSAVIPTEQHHAASATWLTRQTLPLFGVIIPSLALAEIAGALARRSGNLVLARSTLSKITEIPTVRAIDVDVALARHAAHLAIDLRLRGADAIYVSLAQRLSLPLFTWDQELLDRATSVIAVRTPPTP